MKGNVRMQRRNPVAQAVVKQTIAFSKAVSVAGTSGVGWGTAVVGDFPSGNILLLGAVGYVQLTSADTDVTATYDGDVSIGTDPATDGTATGTKVNLMALTSLGAATARTSPRVRGVAPAGALVLDNTDGSLEINLNVLIDDATISGTADMTATGVLHVSYVVLGDD